MKMNILSIKKIFAYWPLFFFGFIWGLYYLEEPIELNTVFLSLISKYDPKGLTYFLVICIHAFTFFIINLGVSVGGCFMWLPEYLKDILRYFGIIVMFIMAGLWLLSLLKDFFKYKT